MSVRPPAAHVPRRMVVGLNRLTAGTVTPHGEEVLHRT